MSNLIYNADTLVGVKVYDKKECHFIQWRERKKWWIFTTQKEGFYSTHYPYEEYTARQLMRGYVLDTPLIVEDNKAYFKPYVKLIFAGGENVIKNFDTHNEAFVWAEEFARKNISSPLAFNRNQ